MSSWEENLERDDYFDPLCVERSAPMDDGEAELIKALCETATPGPLVVDDDTEGEGAVVVSLPDGRIIISLAASIEHTEDDGVMDANAQLICKSRYALLRLLRDRQQWKHQKEFLENRIRTLETLLASEEEVGELVGHSPR